VSNKKSATVSEKRYFIVDRHKVRGSMGVDMQIVQRLLDPREVIKLEGCYVFKPLRNTAMCRNETMTMGSCSLDPETCSVPEIDVFLG